MGRALEETSVEREFVLGSEEYKTCFSGSTTQRGDRSRDDKILFMWIAKQRIEVTIDIGTGHGEPILSSRRILPREEERMVETPTNNSAKSQPCTAFSIGSKGRK